MSDYKQARQAMGIAEQVANCTACGLNPASTNCGYCGQCYEAKQERKRLSKANLEAARAEVRARGFSNV